MLYYFEFLGLFGFWFCAGAVLLSIELLLGGSAFFLTLACAAFVTSVAAGLHDGMTWAASFAVFAVLLIPAVVAWRWYIRNHKQERRDTLNNRAGRLVGTVGMVEEESPGFTGRIRVDDGFWPYESDTLLQKGDRIKIVDIKGNIVKVEKTNGRQSSIQQ
jgi:membrane protein implicated in regulation of membrane protease activity